jgi:hypothetical protein
MPIFEVEAPDGKRFEIEAADQSAAAAAFDEATAPGGPLYADSRISGAFDAAADEPETDLTTRGEAAARGMSQGASLGFGDEMAAAGDASGLSPWLDAVPGGAITRMGVGAVRSWLQPEAAETYDASLTAERGKLAAARQEHPVSSALGEVGGAVATAPMTPAIRAAQGAGVAGRALTNAATGGAYGLTYGFGSGEGGLENRLDNAAAEGAIGAVGGGVLSPVIDAGAAVLRGLGSLAAPLTKRGRESMAGRSLAESATDPAAALRELETGPGELVAGSLPTTAQKAGDMGLLGLERGVANRRPDAFQARRAEQNAARVGTLEGIQPNGHSEAVQQSIRGNLAAVDQTTQRELNDLTTGAADSASRLGGDGTPEGYGATLRGAAAESRETARTRKSELYGAVDPDGSMVMPGASIATAARSIVGELPPSAKRPSGEEAAIFAAAGRYGEAVPFRDAQALRARINDAMAAEWSANGSSQSHRRMGRILAALDETIDGAGRAAPAAVPDAPSASLQGSASGSSAVPKTGSAVFTPAGRRVDVQYEVVEGDSLIASQTPDMRQNLHYPPNLQPRDRSRAASEIQVQRIAGDLQPERLGASTSPADGAPIVGPDGVVESGNARVLGLLRAHKANGPQSQAYRRFLEEQGFSPSGMRAPVLVRRRTSELSPQDRVKFAEESNTSAGLSMSASERASVDARNMPAGLLGIYQGGDVTSAANRDFVRGFLQSVSTAGEEGAFVTGKGALSQEGAQRVRNALLQSAYGDSALVASLAENADEGLRTFGSALSEVSGDFAKLRRGIEAGEIANGVDLAPAIVEAANLVRLSKQMGSRLPDLIAQADAFGGGVSYAATKILRAAYGEDLAGRVSKTGLASLLKSYSLEASQQTNEARLFGAPLTVGDILDGIDARHVAGTASSGSSARAPAFGSGGRETGVAARGFSGPSPGTAGQGGGRSGPEILGPARPAGPPLDAAAAARLRAANAAHGEFKQTFDSGPVGSILAGPRRGQFTLPDSAVPSKVFVGGPRGHETVQAYRRAAGDQEAMVVLQDYVASALRRAAGRPDGTLDPAKVQGWRKFHADALRAFPELDARFASASRASEAMAAAAEARKASMDAYQKGVIGKLLKADPEDVAGIVGGVLSTKEPVAGMRRVVAEIHGNKDARQGLRKAVAEFMLGKMVGNTEAATTGIGTLKSDGFQNFIRQNRAALRLVFSNAEISTMEAVAADLQRANRSIAAVRIPGQSNTAQDLLSGGDTSVLGRVVREGRHQLAGVIGVVTGVSLGPVSGLAALVGVETVTALRQAGLRKVDELILDAMLNPERAKVLLRKTAASGRISRADSLAIANAYARAALVGGTSAVRDRQDTKAPPVNQSGMAPGLSPPPAIIGPPPA